MDGKCCSCPAKPSPSPSAPAFSTSGTTESAAPPSSAPNVRHPHALLLNHRDFGVGRRSVQAISGAREDGMLEALGCCQPSWNRLLKVGMPTGLLQM